MTSFETGYTVLNMENEMLTGAAFEASDLGFPVGHAPIIFKHQGETWRFLRRDTDLEGDTVAYIYRSADWGRTLTVFND